MALNCSIDLEDPPCDLLFVVSGHVVDSNHQDVPLLLLGDDHRRLVGKVESGEASLHHIVNRLHCRLVMRKLRIAEASHSASKMANGDLAWPHTAEERGNDPQVI